MLRLKLCPWCGGIKTHHTKRFKDSVGDTVPNDIWGSGFPVNRRGIPGCRCDETTNRTKTKVKTLRYTSRSQTVKSTCLSRGLRTASRRLWVKDLWCPRVVKRTFLSLTADTTKGVDTSFCPDRSEVRRRGQCERSSRYTRTWIEV